MIVTRAQYAAWHEAYELSGAELTAAAIGQDCNTHGDPDDTNRGPTERDAVTEPDEALAVLRHMAVNEDEAEAFEQVEGDLARLRIQRQAVLDLAADWEQRAWDRGGDHTARTVVHQLREALGCAP